MKKKVLAVLLATAMLVPACGAKEEPAQIPDITEEQPVAEEETEGTEEEPVEEEPEEVVVLPYMEENGIELGSEYVLNAPYALALLMDGEPADIPQVHLNLGDTALVVESVSVEPAEKEGYVVYTIKTSSFLQPEFTNDFDFATSYGFRFTYPDFGLVDYYSGVVFPSQKTDGDEHMGFDNELSVNWEDEVYLLSYSKEREDIKYWTDWVEAENGWSHSYFFDAEYTFSVCVPEAYDGLCLYALRKGYTEIDFDEVEDIDNEKVEYLLDPDEDTGETYTAADFLVLRVKDLVGIDFQALYNAEEEQENAI